MLVDEKEDAALENYPGRKENFRPSNTIKPILRLGHGSAQGVCGIEDHVNIERIAVELTYN